MTLSSRLVNWYTLKGRYGGGGIFTFTAEWVRRLQFIRFGLPQRHYLYRDTGNVSSVFVLDGGGS